MKNVVSGERSADASRFVSEAAPRSGMVEAWVAAKAVTAGNEPTAKTVAATRAETGLCMAFMEKILLAGGVLQGRRSFQPTERD